MEADRRLVENVEHADQPAADLPGEANPLGFAAGQRRSRAIEREIIESHVDEKAEPAADFLEQFGGDRLAGGIEFEAAEKLGRVGNRQTADLGERALGSGGEFRMSGRERDATTLRARAALRRKPRSRTTLMYFSNWRRWMRLFEVR